MSLVNDVETPPLAGTRIFVVEDETLVAMLLEDMIGDLGGTIMGSASRLSRALEIVADRASDIDLAVLDVNLGGEEAFPIAEVQTVLTDQLIFVRAEMSEDEAYWIARTMAENLPRVRALHVSLGKLELADFANNGGMEFHPGVARYWREAGVLR